MKNNIYYIVYKILMDALNDDNIYNGLSKSLEIVKSLYLADDVNVFIKEGNNYKVFLKSDNKELLISLSIVNNCMDEIESKEFYKFNISIDNINNIIYMHIDNYIVGIMNAKAKLEHNLINIIKDTLNVILKKIELFRMIEVKSNTDILTGVFNRNFYEESVKTLDLSDNKYIYAIFDLFRLKYLNDNYSHSLGDFYITETASILNKYFGSDSLENKITKNSNIGSYIYRIGGDEFVIITDVDTIDLVKIKAKLAALEISNLDLGKNLTLGLNYGIAERTLKETAKELYLKADKSLITDKNRMYKVLGLDRRR